ncbi:hypothetical protein cypCar_00016613 [Cyprinus carpio]|nr:hypothetical protein cypCar_00016613 [Cyprinus carpio]
MLVLLDGDYIACQKTDWNGVYVSDDQQHVKWYQPTEPVPGKNETELQALTFSFIAESQTSGFVMLLVLGIILIVVVFCVYRCTGEEPPQTTEDRGDYMGTFACYRSEANLPLQLDFE